MDEIFWVCVLYNTIPDDSLTLISLSKIFKSSINLNHNILIYDNSLNSTNHNPENPGLAVAYNYALKIAAGFDKKWLVLLDQDSELGSDFLIQLVRSLDEVEKDDSIVAIIPSVYDEKTLVSPSKLISGVLNLPYRGRVNDKINGGISAINSGSAISINFLNSISGFNEDFPLDILDHWLYYKIFLLKRSVYLNSAILKHSLSVARGTVSFRRYKSILLGEKKLFCEIKKQRILYSTVLLLRTAKQLLKGQFSTAKMTILFLLK